MKRPRMAFVVTMSMLSLAACEKTPKGGGGGGGGGECKPPDCHMNPPPLQPQPIVDAGNTSTPQATPPASAK